VSQVIGEKLNIFKPDASEAEPSNVVSFPYPMPASCDEFPIWWSTAQVKRHLASQRKLAKAWKRAKKDGANGKFYNMGDDEYRHRADAEDPYHQQQQQQEGGKRWGKSSAKDEPAPGAPEPDPLDFQKYHWQGHTPILHVYRDEHGGVHTVVARWGSGEKKRIVVYHWARHERVEARWLNRWPPHPVLYRLPQVLAGVLAGKEIVFLEGEKDVDGAVWKRGPDGQLYPRGLEEKLGVVFTCTLGGALNNARTGGVWNKTGPDGYSAVSGARVTLVPDPNGAGAAWCEGVADCLRRLNGSYEPPTIRVGTIPPLSENWHNGDVPPKAWGFGDPTPAAAREGDIERIITDAVPFAEWKKPPLQDGERGAPIEWPEPEPIEAPLLPVPAFDVGALLPGGIRDFVVDVTDRMGCPIEYVAVSTISFASSVIGAHCAIRPKRADNWLLVAALWGAIVGDPSRMKSPAMKAALKPLERLIRIAMEEYEAAAAQVKAEAKVNKRINKLKGRAIDKKIEKVLDDDEKLQELKEELIAEDEEEEDGAPAMRRYMTNDPSVEAIGEKLRDNPGGLLYWRDELVGMIATWDKQGREGDRQFYLEAWHGDSPYLVDRIARGTIIMQNLCVTIFGGMQPDKLTAYLEKASDALGNDGLLQRFQLLVYPDPTPGEYRDKVPNKRARERVDQIFERLADFDAEAWGASKTGLKFPYFSFDDEAQEVYIKWTTYLHQKIDAEPDPLIKQHLAKYDKLMPALALVFHMIGLAQLNPDALAIRVATDGSPRISEECAMRAAAWCDFLEPHARRCYGLAADGGLRSAQSLAKKLAGSDLRFDPTDFTARDVRRNHWQHLNEEKEVEAALDWLENKGWLFRRDKSHSPGIGRPTEHYALNPRVRKPKEKENQ